MTRFYHFKKADASLIDSTNLVADNATFTALMEFPGGPAEIEVAGAFDSGSLQLEQQEADGSANWTTRGAAITTAGRTDLGDLPTAIYRLVLTGVVAAAATLRFYIVPTGRLRVLG